MNPTAWKTAEQAAFDFICEATESTSGKNAFLGRPPAGAVLNSWWMNTGPADQVAKPRPGAGVTVYLVGVWTSRDDAMSWPFKLFDKITTQTGYVKSPITYLGCFRANEVPIPVLTPQEVELGNGRTAMVYRAEFQLFLAFTTA